MRDRIRRTLLGVAVSVLCLAVSGAAAVYIHIRNISAEAAHQAFDSQFTTVANSFAEFLIAPLRATELTADALSLQPNNTITADAFTRVCQSIKLGNEANGFAPSKL